MTESLRLPFNSSNELKVFVLQVATGLSLNKSYIRGEKKLNGTLIESLP
jgi:hypothetical protein